MNQKQQAKFQIDISDAYQSLTTGDAPAAVIKFKKMLKQWPKQPQVNHLLALAYKATGEYKLSEKSFKAALAISNRQPEVHNNLANLYKAQGSFVLAEQHYTEAVKQQPDYTEAQRNLGLCFDAQGKYTDAIGQFNSVLARDSTDVIALTALANAERELGLHDMATTHYEQALKANPSYANAWHNSGVNHHLQGDLENARERYAKALQLNPVRTEIVQSYAMTLHEIGNTQEALQVLQQWLQNQPLDIAVHESLNELIWQSDQQDQFGSSYQQAIDRHPEALPLRTSLISQFLRAGLHEQAREHIELAKNRFQENHVLLVLEGRLLAEHADYDLAYQALSHALDLHFSEDAARQKIKLCLLTERYDDAQLLINALLEANPDCQLSWAYQSLVWRLMSNERYHWLCDYQQLVRSYQLETPNGYATQTQFLESLQASLLGLHKADNAPLQQTLRNGTQTAARLFHRADPEIQSLSTSLKSIISSYVSELKADSEHPLLRRNTNKFEISGSWSVKLRANGFHVNHVHPAGWVSSSCYISIPSSVNSDNKEKQGAIKFGESPLQLGSREVVERTIIPQPGMVVLFPSYMWHGTIPFNGEVGDFRLTSPFDVAPC